jgi:hypothetical protein
MLTWVLQVWLRLCPLRLQSLRALTRPRRPRLQLRLQVRVLDSVC